MVVRYSQETRKGGKYSLMIKRIVIETDLNEKPFKEGETLWSYAERIIREAYSNFTILDISPKVEIIELGTHEGPKTIPGRQIVEIDFQVPFE